MRIFKISHIQSLSFITKKNLLHYIIKTCLHISSAFGSIQGGRSYNSNSYRFGFQAREKDDELKGLSNSYDFGNRFYDARLGRWLSIDPEAKLDSDMSPYNGFGNNPIMFIDPDGKKIVVPNVKDRVTILKLINSKSANVYAINDKTGELYLKTKVDKPGIGHSKYYSEKLEKAIMDGETIKVSISQTYVDEKGKVKDVDKDAGGGVTKSRKDANPMNPEVYQEITISGNSNENIKDSNGKPLKDDAADILVHELVGHAIPKIVGTDSGNAVKNENKVRKEADPDAYRLRAEEPNHVE